MYILIILYSRKCLWQASYTQSTVQVEGEQRKNGGLLYVSNQIFMGHFEGSVLN